MLVRVETATLARIGAMFDAGKLVVRIGEVMPLAEIIRAHEMLDGTRPHAEGKIVLRLS